MEVRDNLTTPITGHGELETVDEEEETASSKLQFEVVQQLVEDALALHHPELHAEMQEHHDEHEKFHNEHMSATERLKAAQDRVQEINEMIRVKEEAGETVPEELYEDLVQIESEIAEITQVVSQAKTRKEKAAEKKEAMRLEATNFMIANDKDQLLVKESEKQALESKITGMQQQVEDARATGDEATTAAAEADLVQAQQELQKKHDEFGDIKKRIDVSHKLREKSRQASSRMSFRGGTPIGGGGSAMQWQKAAEAARAEAEQWKAAAEAWRDQCEEDSEEECHEGSALSPVAEEASVSGRGSESPAETRKRQMEKARTANAAQTTRKKSSKKDKGASVESVASAVNKNTEAQITAAVQDVLLTVQHIINPIASKLNRCERATKRVTQLTNWANAIAPGGEGKSQKGQDGKASSGRDRPPVDDVLEVLEAKMENLINGSNPNPNPNPNWRPRWKI